MDMILEYITIHKKYTTMHLNGWYFGLPRLNGLESYWGGRSNTILVSCDSDGVINDSYRYDDRVADVLFFIY